MYAFSYFNYIFEYGNMQNKQIAKLFVIYIYSINIHNGLIPALGSCRQTEAIV